MEDSNGNIKQRLCLIANPHSGNHDKGRLLEKVTAYLQANGFIPETVYTNAPGHATTIASEAASDPGIFAVVAIGGDGTVNETASGLVGTDTPMGIIPAGSGNGLARHIEIPLDPLQAAGTIVQRNVQPCDFGTVNGRPFFCTFGAGYDAAVAQRFAASGHRGPFTYVKSAFVEFAHYEPHHYRIIADGRALELDAFLIAVCNANQYGNNAYIAPLARITDGLLDVVVIHRMPKWRTFLLGFDLLSGTLGNHTGITHLQAKNITIERSENGPAHIDGEPWPDAGNNLSIACHPGQINVLTEPRKKPFRPILTPMEALTSNIKNSIHHIVS